MKSVLVKFISVKCPTVSLLQVELAVTQMGLYLTGLIITATG